jgi:phenylacetate-CoA ligase
MLMNSPYTPALTDAVQRRDAIAYMEALNRLRMHKLNDQLAYCFRNEYYGQKMREAGVNDPADIRTIDDFRALPAFLTKALHRQSQTDSLERYGHPFGMHLCAPIERVIHVAGTSGTTGLPTFYLFTKKDLELTYLTIGRTLKMAGLRPGDSALQLFGLSIWVAGTTLVQAAEAYGARPIPLGAEAGVTKALQYIKACKPRALFATPSMLSHLIDRALEVLGQPLNTCGIEIVLTGGEPGMAIPAFRKRIQEGTGAKVFDWSSGAWTNATCECGGPEHQGMHYLAEDYCFRYDLVDPDTRKPVPLVDGATGEAIHTALEYEAAPALRYATGDILHLRVGECPHCGHFGSRFYFVGRADDLMNVSGVKVYPNAVKEVVERFAPEVTGKMQILLGQPLPRVIPPIKMVVEAADAVPREQWPGLASRIEAAVHLALKIRVKINLVPAASLPTTNLKTKLVHIVSPEEAKA